MGVLFTCISGADEAPPRLLAFKFRMLFSPSSEIPGTMPGAGTTSQSPTLRCRPFTSMAISYLTSRYDLALPHQGRSINLAHVRPRVARNHLSTGRPCEICRAQSIA